MCVFVCVHACKLSVLLNNANPAFLSPASFQYHKCTPFTSSNYMPPFAASSAQNYAGWDAIGLGGIE